MYQGNITALVVDDDQRSSEVLKLHLEAIPNVVVPGVASGADEALHMLLERVPDMLFLDVEMPEKTGFDLVTDLKRLNIQTCVVFQTAYDKYAIQAIKSAAFDYLMKPIDPDELREVVAKYRASRETSVLSGRIDELLSHLNQHKKIRFNTRHGFIMIDPAEIVYFQADWNYTEIWFSKEKKELVTMNIGKVEELLSAEQFIRISRSIIINRKKIDKLERKSGIVTLFDKDQWYEFRVAKPHLKKFDDI